MTKLSPGFKRIVGTDVRLEIAPLLYNCLDRELLPDFTVKVRGGKGDRKPDDWFHPSSHPLMTERQLYHYLVDPDDWAKKPFPYPTKMSAKMGSITHDIVETAMKVLGLLVTPQGTCAACGRSQPDECGEHGVVDLVTGSRGHMDGVIEMDGYRRGFELKSAAPRAIESIKDNDLAAFRKKWPYYYSQIQEYMRMSGLVEFKVLFFGMGFPWDMREFTILADPEFQAEVAQKYLAVREMVKTRTLPIAFCCGPKSAMAKECPALICEMKRYG